MEFRASLDTLAKVMTLGSFILFTVLGYISLKVLLVSERNITIILIHSGLIVFFIATILGCYLYAPQSYRIENGDLIIVRPASNKKIKLTDIETVRMLADSEMKGTIRTFGNGGLFGYYGKFYAPKIGNMTFYATRRKNLVLILTKQGQKIVITPDDAEMIEKLKEKLMATTT